MIIFKHLFPHVFPHGIPPSQFTWLLLIPLCGCVMWHSSSKLYSFPIVMAPLAFHFVTIKKLLYLIFFWGIVGWVMSGDTFLTKCWSLLSVLIRPYTVSGFKLGSVVHKANIWMPVLSFWPIHLIVLYIVLLYVLLQIEINIYAVW